MALKFIRENSGRERPHRSYDPPRLFGSGGRTDLKRRLLIIYVGAGILLFALAFGKMRERFDTFDGQPVLRGAAVITGIQDGALLLEINGMGTTFMPEPGILSRLKTGDRVAVLYQRSQTGHRVRVLEVGAAPMGGQTDRSDQSDQSDRS